MVRTVIDLTCNRAITLTFALLLLWSFCPQTQVSAGEPSEILATAPSNDQAYDHHGRALTLPTEIGFNAHVRGLMSNTCFTCHGPDEEQNKSGLRLDSFESAVEEGDAIEPGDAEESAVYQRLMDDDEPMPPAEFLHQLTDYEKAVFKSWIEQGAKYEEHWAYTPIEQPELPASSVDQKFIKNAVDAFVFDKLQRAGMKYSPEADKPTLLRRLSLDLIGLPPTPAEVEEFLSDDSSDAYEKQVDRLLASPHFGERMAAYWLDIVRFSDTVGYHGDQNQRIFPYRDYVIESLNSNQPFDEFTREQLAGDLMENPTVDQLTATGLIRLNMVTREGGAQPGEYLAKYTADRVRMLGTAWMGATTGCCECHNHKYDPFSIEDFYSLGAYFDDVRQWGVYTSYGYTPNPDLAGFNNNFPFPPEMRLESDSLKEQIAFLENQLASEMSAKLKATKLNSSKKFQGWLSQLQSALDAGDDQWSVMETDDVVVATEAPKERLDDGTLLLTGPPVESQMITFSKAFKRPAVVRTVQLEVLPHDKNNGYIGRSKDGKFSAEVSIRKQVDGSDVEPLDVVPRFLRIETPGTLSLAEVQAFADVDGKSTNVALKGKASQSTTDYDGDAKLAIDGNTDGNYRVSNSVTHTKLGVPGWWELDLGKPQRIQEIKIWNRTDNNYGPRLKGVRVILLDANHQPLFQAQPALPKPSIAFAIPEVNMPVGLQRNAAISFRLANRYRTSQYVSGHPNRYLDDVWKSGPRQWQLPSDEAKRRHVATYHLEQPLKFAEGETLRVEIRSSDVGRIRLSTSPASRTVAGAAAMNESLAEAVMHSKTTAFDELSDQDKTWLRSSYYQFLTPFDRQSRRSKELRNGIADCHSGLAFTLVSQPVDDGKMRKSRVLPRGNWQDESGKLVTPDTPHFLPRQVKPEAKRQTRMDLANWLTSKENPLVARHYVNRVWDQFFGTGLSSQIDDLGNQGEWPSHPDLLDWLASEFQQSWDRKKVVRLIVTSHAYRQRAAVDKAHFEADPYNRMLSHQSARRLEAEVVRDNALSIAGLLNTQWVGGPSVFPYQPPGYYANIQFPNRTYRVDYDGRQYRRGIYMHWQRTFLHPMLTNFDAPARDECVAKRTQSNSPQQALTMLNDPVFVEASRAFAMRLTKEAKSASLDDRLKLAFQLALAREPSKEELKGLSDLYETQHKYFVDNPSDVERFQKVGRFRADKQTASLPEHAALAQVCRVLLNLHETITRY